MIDFHNHLLPGVDDGAATLDETRAALAAFREQGVRAVVVTPHLRGSLTAEPARLEETLARMDAAWEEASAMAAAEFPEVRLERGFEVMLDTPRPDLSDPRLRLAGTRFVLVEFPFMSVPPNAAATLFELRMAGWHPILAHPERYTGIDEALSGPGEWRRVGAHLQVNGASLIGKYGDEARRTAWRLLRRGWADYVCSDYHARGRLHAATARAEIERAAGAEAASLLTEGNAARMLAGESPLPPPAFGAQGRGGEEKPSLWKRLFGGGGQG